MFDLLQIEWLKVKKYNTFWIISLLFLILIALTNHFIISGIMNAGAKGVNVLVADYSFSNVWNKVSYITKVFSGLLSVIIIILTTNEFQFRTNRQNIIDGWKREQFFHAKWGVVIVLSLVVTIYAVLQGIFFGLSGGSPFADIGNNFINILYVFILTLNYFGLALTLSLFLKRSGMVIIIFLLYSYIVELLLNQFLSAKMHSTLGYYLPMDSSANLLPVSKVEPMSSMVINSAYSTQALIFVSIFWIAAYYTIGRIKMIKSDW